MRSFKMGARWFVALLAVGTGGYAAFHAGFSAKAQAPSASGEETADPNAADRQAIRKTVATFAEAFEKGDAKALAAHWTENGEYLSDDGQTFRGRASIEKEYAAAFAKRKGKPRVEIEVDALRFPSKDTAIEEGHFKVFVGKDLGATSKYTVLHVREGGQWRMAVVREWSASGASLRELDWLIGTWAAEREGLEIRSEYEWWGDKNFIRAQFSIKAKERSLSGFQMIAVDPTTGRIRSWAFDPDGSFGEAGWSRDGKKWKLESASVLADGKTLAATNIITPIDRDAFLFQSVERSVDGEALADIAPIRVKRVRSKD